MKTNAQNNQMRESLCPDSERIFVVTPASEKEEWDS